MTTTYTITENRTYNSREVTFDNKPSRAVLDALKNLGLKWNHKKSCWYGYATESSIRAAILEHGNGETITGEETAATVCTDGYLGGGAVYGSKSNKPLYGSDLVKAMREDLKNAGIKGVTLRRKSYTGGQTITATVTFQPEDITPAAEYLNSYDIKYSQSWIYTGSDSIHVDKYFSMTAEEQHTVRRAAAEFDLTKFATTEQCLNHYHLNKYTEFTPAFLQKLENILSVVMAYHYDNSNPMVDYFDTNFYFDLYTKPSNPTPPEFPADLADLYTATAEEVTEPAEETETQTPPPAETAEDSAALVSIPLTFFSAPRNTATPEATTGPEPVPTPEPDPATAPTVTIIWSEHPRIKDGQTLTLSEAANLTANLDYFVHSARQDPDYSGAYYYKTKFRIDFIYHGQPDTYEGRQDLGDGDGSLIDHIRAFAECYADNPNIDRDIRDQCAEVLREFVPYLTLHSNLDDLTTYARKALKDPNITIDEASTARAILDYIKTSRKNINDGIYDIPEPPLEEIPLF